MFALIVGLAVGFVVGKYGTQATIDTVRGWFSGLNKQ